MSTTFAAMNYKMPKEIMEKLRKAHELLSDAYFELTRLEKEEQNEQKNTNNY